MAHDSEYSTTYLQDTEEKGDTFAHHGKKDHIELNRSDFSVQDLLQLEVKKLRVENRSIRKELLELSNVRNDNNVLQDEVDRLNEEIRKLTISNREQRTKSGALVSNLESEKMELEDRLKASAQDINKANALVRSLEQKLRESEDNVAFVQNLIREREYELSCSQSQRVNLVNNLNQNKAMMETQWKNTLNQVEKKQRVLEIQNAELKQKIASLGEQERRTKKEYKRMMNKVECNIKQKKQMLVRVRRALQKELSEKEKLKLETQMHRETKVGLEERHKVICENLFKAEKELAGLKEAKTVTDQLLKSREEELALKDSELINTVFEQSQSKNKIVSSLRKKLEDESFVVNSLKTKLNETRADLKEANEQILAHHQVFATLNVRLDSINTNSN